MNFSKLFMVPILIVITPAFVLYNITSTMLKVVGLMSCLLRLGVPCMSCVNFRFKGATLDPVPMFVLSLVAKVVLFLLKQNT